ncbi:hypothetical protein LIPSTDRAFT_73066 [Lipomyces starkeyi NRRL Y-11557]|uniref:Uncharacterized protein n=1 Tax=Lipomyces starkeyi NRRL Y-11557 TaxID=675824 RepID=A0A1E3Q134_LIPST|nr:hypothetical protein LIPSTDRAFT_73066 [Lipomyces starkeyi NRRL Y-11557]
MLSRTQRLNEIKKLKDEGRRISEFAARELARSSALARICPATDGITAAYLLRMQWRRYHMPDGTLSISWTPASGLNHLKQPTCIASTPCQPLL